MRIVCQIWIPGLNQWCTAEQGIVRSRSWNTHRLQPIILGTSVGHLRGSLMRTLSPTCPGGILQHLLQQWHLVIFLYTSKVIGNAGTFLHSMVYVEIFVVSMSWCIIFLYRNKSSISLTKHSWRKVIHTWNVSGEWSYLQLEIWYFDVIYIIYIIIFLFNRLWIVLFIFSTCSLTFWINSINSKSKFKLYWCITCL